MTTATAPVLALVALVACGKSEEQVPPAEPRAASAASEPKRATTRPERLEPRSTIGGPPSELVHRTDANQHVGFQYPGELAVAGGWVYWIEKSRADFGKHVLMRKRTSGPGSPEKILESADIWEVVADAEHVFLLAGSVQSRSHAGGEWKVIAPGKWSSIEVGKNHLLLRNYGQLGLVEKQGGPVEPVWKGKSRYVAADGDRFYVLEGPEVEGPTRRITIYEPGKQPSVLAEIEGKPAQLAVHGDHVYFSGKAERAPLYDPLWRVHKIAGGTPEPVGERDVSFGSLGSLLIHGDTIYGAAHGPIPGAPRVRPWHIQKLPVKGGKPVQIDAGSEYLPSASLAADEHHLYYLTRHEVMRVAL